MATEQPLTTDFDPSLEESIKTRIREECADLFEDHISALFADKKAIKESMLGFLMKEQVTILGRVLGMEPDPFNQGQLRFRSDSAKLVGALVPLETLAIEAVDEWVKKLDQDAIRKQIDKAMVRAEKAVMERVLNSIEYNMRDRVNQHVNKLMDEHATRIAKEMFGNFSVLRENEHDRRRKRQEIAERRREAAILKRRQEQLAQS